MQDWSWGDKNECGQTLVSIVTMTRTGSTIKTVRSSKENDRNIGRAYAWDREHNPKQSNRLNDGGTNFHGRGGDTGGVMERLLKKSDLMVGEVQQHCSWSEFRCGSWCGWLRGVHWRWKVWREVEKVTRSMRWWNRWEVHEWNVRRTSSLIFERAQVLCVSGWWLRTPKVDGFTLSSQAAITTT